MWDWMLFSKQESDLFWNLGGYYAFVKVGDETSLSNRSDCDDGGLVDGTILERSLALHKFLFRCCN